ncbi:MAG: virulence RhuM family protein [Paludibacter sp.]|nr:virulence RhuM family protein [Paludibacter sp.]
MDNELEKKSQFLFYRGHDGNVKIQVILGDETIWATQTSMADIFETTKQNISYHLINIFAEHELNKETTVKEILTVQKEGGRNVNRNIEFYNLDAIISVGYRISSPKATEFRIWATSVIKEYLIKGFVLDDERLKQGKQSFGKDYFNELLERIREIRASERRFYQKITDLYAQASIDYDVKSPITQKFYATVQNKLHFAISNDTAAGIIVKRANSLKPNMGLTTWKNAKQGGKILRSDVSVAKNYLSQEEISDLNRIVNMYLDYAELQAKRNVAMKMVDWVDKLDKFLEFNGYELLKDPGKMSHDIAKKISEREFEKYRIIQDREYVSDFDKVVDEINTTGKLPQTRSISISIKNVLNNDLSKFDKNIKKTLDFNPKDKKDKENKK